MVEAKGFIYIGDLRGLLCWGKGVGDGEGGRDQWGGVNNDSVTGELQWRDGWEFHPEAIQATHMGLPPPLPAVMWQ